ncbi:S24 family peptidase [Burkholderia seminalis]|nr:S24 family peptidase [Burkholderia seminalis]
MASGVANVRPAPVGVRRIPLISSVQAGQMTEAVDPFPQGGAFEYLLTDLDLSDNAFALEIDGDSMLPDFHPGDRVIVDPAICPRPGDFVVAKNGREEATFKKYRARGIGADGREAFELIPLNPDYAAISSEHEPVRIIGVMVEHRRYRKR